MTDFLHGMAFAGFLLVAVWFLRSWLGTRDSLLLTFAVAFAMLAVNRILIASASDQSEAATSVYLLRAAAFGLIIAAVIARNRRQE